MSGVWRFREPACLQLPYTLTFSPVQEQYRTVYGQ